jgi:hypothetical protein
VYPSRYRLAELTSHVLALLERRREGFAEWNAETEAQLKEAAVEALKEAGRQFAELADDKPYWSHIEQTVLTAVLPRYFQAAKDEQALEKNKYNLWRGGDFVSRVMYGGAGLLAAVIIWRTAIPDYLEPLPLAFFVINGNALHCLGFDSLNPVEFVHPAFRSKLLTAVVADALLRLGCIAGAKVSIATVDTDTGIERGEASFRRNLRSVGHIELGAFHPEHPSVVINQTARAKLG